MISSDFFGKGQIQLCTQSRPQTGNHQCADMVSAKMYDCKSNTEESVDGCDRKDYIWV